MDAQIKMLKRFYHILLKFIQLIIVVLATVLIIIVFSSVISRYFLNTSIAWAEEVSRFIFVWMMLLGAILLHDTYSHMSIDILFSVVSKRVKFILQIISSAVIIIVLCILINGGFIISVESLVWMSPAVGFPYGIVNSIIPISCSIMVLQTLARIYAITAEYFGKYKKTEDSQIGV